MSVDVGVVKLADAVYPQAPPYHPSERYPEYPFGESISGEPNHVYAAVRELLFELGYDHDNFGNIAWNPLGFLIQPVMTVALSIVLLHEAPSPIQLVGVALVVGGIAAATLGASVTRMRLPGRAGARA